MPIRLDQTGRTCKLFSHSQLRGGTLGNQYGTAFTSASSGPRRARTVLTEHHLRSGDPAAGLTWIRPSAEPTERMLERGEQHRRERPGTGTRPPHRAGHRTGTAADAGGRAGRSPRLRVHRRRRAGPRLLSRHGDGPAYRRRGDRPATPGRTRDLGLVPGSRGRPDRLGPGTQLPRLRLPDLPGARGRVVSEGSIRSSCWDSSAAWTSAAGTRPPPASTCTRS